MKIHNKVLLVEDDRDFATLIGDFLASKGFELITAFDAPGAFDALEKHNPSLVLLDLVIPGGSAFEICRRASEGAGRGEGVPVIVLSSKTSLEAKIKCFMNGALRYLTKPFDLEDLSESISAVMYRKAQSKMAM